MEIHLQGLSFNAIECDEIGSATVSFVPIKPGSYEFYVGNVPLAVGRPMGESGPQMKGKSVLGTFLVNYAFSLLPPSAHAMFASEIKKAIRNFQ